MKPETALRTASILMLLHAIGHTVGALTWKKASSPAIQKVVDDMLKNHFAFMGKQISLGDFFDGYGLIMIGVLLLITVQLWQQSGEPARQQALPLGLFLMLMGIMEIIYFFPFAAVFTLLAAGFTLYAYLKSPLWKRLN